MSFAPRSGFLQAAALAVLATLVWAVGAARGQDLQGKLDSTQAELDQNEEREGVLSSELDRYNTQLDQLAGEVAVLRNREAIVQAELDRVKAELRRERDRLETLKGRLRSSLNELRRRLVAIYRSDEPDVLTVMLESDGFDDLISRYEYLRRIEEQDATIVGRVRGLRNESRDTVARIEAARDEIAAKKAELERTRVQLEAREAELDSVRNQKAAALRRVRRSATRLEGRIGELEDKIQAQLRAAQASSSAMPVLPAGPIREGEGSGFIWPITGTLTSPFGPRWGRLHAGIDLAAPGGTPIRAADDGTIVLAEPYGGYGNYTCIDHGGGLSTCYAHQSSFAVTSGPVDQGTVIGYVGNTGASFGDHLHFEIRVNGTPVDPLGYL